MWIYAQTTIRPAVALVFLLRGSYNPSKIPATAWRPFNKVKCVLLLSVSKENFKVKSLPPVYSWHSEEWHDTIYTWPAMTLQHSVSRNIQLCPVIGMSTCKLQVGRSRVSRALSTPAEHTGRLMQSQICSPYPRHVSS